MKRILIGILIFVMPAISFASDVSYLSGTVTLRQNDTAYFSIDSYYIGEERTEYAIYVDAEGRFELLFDLDHWRMASFSYGQHNKELFVEPGDSILISIDVDVIKVEGKGEENNRFLSSFYTKFNEQIELSLMEEKLLSTGIDEFEILLFENRKVQKEYLRTYEANTGLSEVFTRFINYTIDYNYFKFLVAYPIIRGNKSSSLVVNPLPKVMLSAINTDMLNNPDALGCESYRDFVYYAVVYYTSKENSFNKFTDQSVSMKHKSKYARFNLKGEVLNWFLADFVYRNCEKVTRESYLQQMAYLSMQPNSVAVIELLKKKCDAITLQNENISDNDKSNKDKQNKYDLNLIGLNGRKASIDDLKGKIVYIDFWASWCGPCRQEFPHSKALQAKFSKKQKSKIAFLYISIDKNEEIWKSAIDKLGIEGVHFLSPGGWSSEVTKYFRINSIPRYMILDKKGNIVDANAKRPSATGIQQDLLKLINEK